MAARTKQYVMMTQAALDEDKNGDIILRGVLKPSTMEAIQVGSYQREILPATSLRKLREAFERGNRVPDIELGMRGGDFEDVDGVFVLKKPVYVVDGLQRLSAAISYRQASGGEPHLGATVHFCTDEKKERDRFRILNQERTKLSPNVMARNLKEDYLGIETIYELCLDPGFVLHNRVCWAQRKTRQELITALILLKTAGQLHGHIGAGQSTKLDELARGLTQIVERVGCETFKNNLHLFFEVVDEAWGIKRAVYTEGLVHLRGTFLAVLAAMMSNHLNFWKEGSELLVPIDLERKISQFPTNDPTVVQLAGSGGQSRYMLYAMLVDHVNRGKRSRRLQTRQGNLPFVLGQSRSGDDDDTDDDTDD